MDFWQKVEKCKHENLTDYYHMFTCGTPYCEVVEVRCRDCKVYIMTCGCNVNTGMSGWPWSRVGKHELAF